MTLKTALLLLFSVVVLLLKWNPFILRTVEAGGGSGCGPGCYGDSDCPSYLACISGRCLDPCLTSRTKCTGKTICEVVDHQVQCVNRPEALREGCFSDGECSVDTACIQQSCKNPCSANFRCANGLQCYIENHKARCLNGPPVRTCTINENCAGDRICVDELCEDPCQFTSCKPDSECQVKDHVVSCIPKEKYTVTTQYVKKTSTWPSCKQKKFFVNPLIKASWLDGDRICKKNNSRLARIESEEEIKTVKQLIDANKIGLEDDWFWIAGRTTDDGDWLWYTTNEKIDKFFWRAGQPSDKSPNNCLGFYGSDVLWWDWECNSKYFILCEYY